MSELTYRDVGDSMLLAELAPVVDRDVNRRAWALARAIERHRWPGVRSVRATFRSVAIAYDPLELGRELLVEHIQQLADAPLGQDVGRVVSVPVVYGGDDGPDLNEVAAQSGLTPAEVVRLHAEPEYHAFLLGFTPGFAYLGPTDRRLVARRRDRPRVRVPAGSVGVAGRQTGVYPRVSPGGWALIGRTNLDMFDSGSSDPCAIRPGDRVRFVPVERLSPLARPAAETAVGVEASTPAITVVRPGILTTVQDDGRHGFEAMGVAPCGAMDGAALHRANAAVSNAPNAAVLEATLAGLELRVERDAVMAVAGADLGARVDDAAVPADRPVRVKAGAHVRLTERRAGARAYVAFAGGVDVPPVLGSRATDLGAGFGGYRGRALRSGDRLACGEASSNQSREFGTLPARLVGSALADGRRASGVGLQTSGGSAGDVALRVLPGPHLDWFTPDALESLQRAKYRISPQSNRVGYRLTSGATIRRSRDAEMISDATVVGGIQVPPDGQPILLMVDCQVTGGYPLVATVISADVDAAGQLAPGDEISFRVCSRHEALAALAEARRA